MLYYKILIFLIVLIFFYFFSKTGEIDRECYSEKNNKNKKIAILIISVSDIDHPYYNIQKKIWKRYYNSDDEIDCFFIECGNKTLLEKNRLQVKCEESFKPGIFQKTILSLIYLANRYDFYIRTNLNSFFIFPHLHNLLDKIENRGKIYTGAYSELSYWVCGNSIILNQAAANQLITTGSKSKYYHDQKTADDVLIGELFRDLSISPYKLENIVYPIVEKKNIKHHQIQKKLEKVDRLKIPIIRTRPKYNNYHLYYNFLYKLVNRYYKL